MSVDVWKMLVLPLVCVEGAWSQVNIVCKVGMCKRCTCMDSPFPSIHLTLGSGLSTFSYVS